MVVYLNPDDLQAVILLQHAEAHLQAWHLVLQVQRQLHRGICILGPGNWWRLASLLHASTDTYRHVLIAQIT